MAAQLAAHSEQLRAAEELCKKAEQLAVTELNAALVSRSPLDLILNPSRRPRQRMLTCIIYI